MLEEPTPKITVKGSSHLHDERKYNAIVRRIENGEFKSKRDFVEYINTEYQCQKLYPSAVRKLVQKYDEVTRVKC